MSKTIETFKLNVIKNIVFNYFLMKRTKRKTILKPTTRSVSTVIVLQVQKKHIFRT